MAFRFPFTNYQELNLDWLISTVKKMYDENKEAASEAESAANAVKNLTVEATTLPPGSSATAVKSMVDEHIDIVFGIPQGEQGEQGEPGQDGQDGHSITPEEATTIINAWLAANIDPDSGYALDRTLSLTTAAAPADMVGYIRTRIANNFVDTATYYIGELVWYNDVLYQFEEHHPAGAWTGTDVTTGATARMSTMLMNISRSLAPPFDKTQAYNIGDYVIHYNRLYRFTTAQAANTAWTAGNVTTVNIADSLNDLESELKNSQITLTSTWTDGKYVAGNNVEIADENYSIAEYDVTGIRGKVKINTYGASAVGWILLDSDNSQIERSLFTNSTGNTYNFVREVDLKANAARLRVSCYTPLKRNHNVVYLVAKNDITPIIAVASTNFDNVQQNSVYTCEVSLTASANKVPYDQFHGTILTLGQVESSQQQFAISYHNRAFTRRKFNTWSQWNELASITPLSATTSTNLNDVTMQFTNIGVGGMTVLTNNVPYDGFQGTVYTIVAGSNFGSQIAVSINSEMYFRRKFSSWGSWNKLANSSQVENLENDYCILSEFDNIFCAGDSLTWGAVYTGSGNNDYRAAKKPYNQILQMRTGVNVSRNAQPGIDAISYVSKLSSITEKTNQLCIIYLGTNGGLTDTVDTDAPGNDKSQYDLSTETGSYCYIVKHCLEVNAKVLLVKIYSGGGTPGVATTNTVIGKIAEKFGVAVIENESLPVKYHMWPNGEGYNTTHLNDFGYAAFAEYLIRQVNTLSAQMLARLLPSS